MAVAITRRRIKGDWTNDRSEMREREQRGQELFTMYRSKT